MVSRSLYPYVFLTFLNGVLLLQKAGSFLTTSQFAGRDLIGAFSLVEAFQLGWTGKWFLGYPMFNFYPPGFFAITGAVGNILTNTIAFKIVVFSSLLFLPATIYYAFKSIYNHDIGLIAGILSFFIIFLRSPITMIYQTLQVGLVAQGLALIFFFLFLGMLWRDKDGYGYLSAIFLGLTIISHPFMGFAATLYLLFYLIYTRNIHKTVTASTGYLLTAFWWIPLIENLWYAHVYTGPTGKLVNLPWLFAPFILIDRTLKTACLIIPSIILLLIGLIDIIPLQHYRFYTYGQIIFIILAAPGLKTLIDSISYSFNFRHITYILGLTVFLTALTVSVQPTWTSDVQIEDITPEDGKVIVETSHSNLYNSYIPNQMIPLESEAQVVNGLYADSSISSPYLLGLEKSFSMDPAPNPLAVKANLTSEQIENRFEYFGINFAVIKTEKAREKLDFMDKISENRDYTLLYRNSSSQIKKKDIITVSGSRSRWEDLNEYIFRNEIVTNIIYLHNSEGDLNIDGLSNQEVLEVANDTKTDKSAIITAESIRIEAEREGVFGLKTDINS